MILFPCVLRYSYTQEACLDVCGRLSGQQVRRSAGQQVNRLAGQQVSRLAGQQVSRLAGQHVNVDGVPRTVTSEALTQCYISTYTTADTHLPSKKEASLIVPDFAVFVNSSLCKSLFFGLILSLYSFSVSVKLPILQLLRCQQVEKESKAVRMRL